MAGYRRRNIDKDTVLKIIELHENGVTKKDIIKRYNLLKNTVYDIISGKTWSNVTGRVYKKQTQKKITEEMSKSVIKMVQGGANKKEAARAHDIHHHSVYRILRGEVFPHLDRKGITIRRLKHSTKKKEVPDNLKKDYINRYGCIVKYGTSEFKRAEAVEYHSKCHVKRRRLTVD